MAATPVASFSPARPSNRHAWCGGELPLSSPPKTSYRSSNQNWQTSLQKELQSITVFLVTHNSRVIRTVRGWAKTNQREQKRHITCWDNFDLSNHVPATKLFENECFLMTFVCPRVIWQLPAGRSGTASCGVRRDIPRGRRHRNERRRWHGAPRGSHVTSPSPP